MTQIYLSVIAYRKEKKDWKKFTKILLKFYLSVIVYRKEKKTGRKSTKILTVAIYF